MYLLNKFSAPSLSILIPTVDKIFCIFSFLILSSCKSFKERAVKAKTDATTKTISAANVNV